MNAAARLQLLRGDDAAEVPVTDRRRRVEPSRSPAVRLLERLSAWKSAPYVCDEARAGRWHADCPVCGRARSVTISELAEDGPVALACATGCSGQAIRDALDHAAGGADAEEWRAIALEAREIIHRQADLIDRLLADQATLPEAA